MENSKISWTDHTFNPWLGCTKVSAGCQHCYAEELMDKRFARVQWGPQGTRSRTSPAEWRKPLIWNSKQWMECPACGWRGERYWTCPDCDRTPTRPVRQRVFCASLADVFEDRPELEEWRHDLFDLILQTPNLDWLLLTKRPENIEPMLRAMPVLKRDNVWDHLWPKYFPNVWLGTSVENQQTADERIPHLLKVPATVHFISMEPLLGPVNLRELTYYPDEDDPDYKWHFEQEGGDSVWEEIDALTGSSSDSFGNFGNFNRMAKGIGIDWVIVGGESGPNARPMHPDWVRSIRDQCHAADVAFFIKQMGTAWAKENSASDTKGGKWLDIPDDLRIREYPENARVDF